MEVHRRLLQLLPLYYLSIILSIFRKSISFLPNLKQFFLSPVAINEFLLSSYFHYCGLSPCTIDLDSETTLHFWIPDPNNNQRTNLNKPNLILIHGFGGNSKWQFYSQIGSLNRDFNLYVPDLVFFGDSYSKRSDRTEKFQARCIGEGLKKLRVDRYSVFGISYGGYVAYRMAEIYREVIEKVVILSCGICCTKEQMEEEMKKVGRDVVEILVPKRVEDLRILMSTAMYRSIPWSPAFMLQDFINVMYMPCRKEKVELLHHLLQRKGDSEPLPVLHQETLIVWGDKDRFFPLDFAYQMARHLGERTRVEIVKDAGHAANMESPTVVNSLIKSFILESQS